MAGIALIAGIGLIGPAMAVFNDGVSIWEQVSTGDLTDKVLFVEVYPEDNNPDHCQKRGTISTRIDNEGGLKDHQIIIDIEREEEETNWVCNFKIKNQGTIPVRFLPPTVIADDALQVEYDLPDKVIKRGKNGMDPGDEVEGQIRIGLNTDVSGTYTFQMDIECIQWNAFNEDPDWWRDTLHIYGTVTLQGLREKPTDEFPGEASVQLRERLPVELPEPLDNETIEVITTQ